MKTWVYLGAMAAGLIMIIYEMYQRANEQYEHSHGPSSGEDDEFEFVPRTGDNHPKAPSRDDTCTVCLEYLISRLNTTEKYGIVSLPCAHWFHAKCILQLPRYQDPYCPVCRSPFDPSCVSSKFIHKHVKMAQ